MIGFVERLFSFIALNTSWFVVGVAVALVLALALRLGRAPIPEARARLITPLTWYAGNRRARQVTVNVLGVLLMLWGAKTFALWIQPTLTASMLVTSPMVGPQPVDVAMVKQSALQETATYTGTVLPYQDNTVYARVDGFVTSLAVYPGDYVHAGQVLATLDTSLLEPRLLEAEAQTTQADEHVTQAEAQVTQSQEQIAQAEEQIAKAAAQATYAEAEFGRESALFKAGAVSASDLDLSRSQFEQARAEASALQRVRQEARAQLVEAHAQVGQAEQQHQQAEAGVALIRTQLGYATVRARMSGWVAQRKIYSGVYVKAGEPLLKIGDFSNVRIHFDVAESDLPYVHPGSVIYLRFPQIDPSMIRKAFATDLGPPGPHGEPTARATVAVVFPTEGLATRTGTVEVRLPNPRFLLKGHTYVVGDVVKQSLKEAVVIPAAALTDASDGKQVVFVAPQFSAQGQVSMRHVTLGLQTDRYVQVLSGLKPGELVVTLGNRELTDGQTVQVMRRSDKGPAS
ncbi:efflux RND transporter periplasmic adaptor subunit [bacterium]|nr:MAG: efflux RND transporter periplasmic adaptor subunit [bacterium]